VKTLVCLAGLLTSAVWADETADRAAIEATVAALNTSPSLPSLFAKDFANANELRIFLTGPSVAPFPAGGITVRTEAATVVISREPMGEASLSTTHGRFVSRSVTFVSPYAGVVVAIYERQIGPVPSQPIPVLFVVRQEESSWRIASFRVLSEAASK
jgi:hypothetical protein